MRARIYVCHTFYHVYVACLKELNLPKEERGKADMVLSTMSCDFGNLSGRLAASGLFGKVFIFESRGRRRSSITASSMASIISIQPIFTTAASPKPFSERH